MNDTVIKAATRIYGVLLLLWPAALRRDYGPEMTLLFRERCTRAASTSGLPGLLVCTVRGWLDLLRGAVFERARERGRRRVGPGAVLQDVRQAVRSYRRQPLFTATILLTLGLGIGASTAIFGLVQHAVLRPLPYPRAGEIQSIVQNDDRFGMVPFAIPYLADFRERLSQFERVAGFTPSWTLTLTGSGEPRIVNAAYVSDGLLEMFGAEIARGRVISAEEHASATARVAVVSRSFWERHFGGRAAFDEPIIRLNETPHVIVGVLRDDLRMPITASVVSNNRTSAEVWLPLSSNELASLRTIPIMNVVGRLRNGVSPAQATAELSAAVAAIGREFPQLAEGGAVRMLPLRDLVSREVRQPLLLLLGAVGGLLLIACANVGNLLLARSAGRTGELAIRVSLGATRLRLSAQMLAESLVLSAAGAAIGLGFAWWILRAFPALGLADLPPSAVPVVDLRVALFAVACATATALFIGVVPALQASRSSPHTLLKQGGRVIGGRGRRLKKALVFTEVAVTLVLLVAAGLLARSFWTLAGVDAGIRADRVLAAGVALPGSRYPTAADKLGFTEAALTRLSAVPGVERAALVNRLPFGGGNVIVGVEIEGTADASRPPTLDRRVVSSGYFETMQIPVLDGRNFDNTDQAGAAEPVAIINSAAAGRYWPDRDPLGQRIRLMLQGGPGPWLRIVGVVGDVRHHGLDRPAEPEIYVPYAQASVESFVLLLRTPSNEPLALAQPLRSVIGQLDPELPLRDVGVAADAIAQSIAEPRTRTLIFNAFALLALLLAAIGIYGVIAQAVASRTREIGVRVAFGARRIAITGMVLREGMGLVAAAAGTGVIIALLLGRLLEAQLFGIRPTDPITFLAVTALLLLVALLAHLVPARRAMRLDPVRALRTE